jgi:hypothetical protein
VRLGGAFGTGDHIDAGTEEGEANCLRAGGHRIAIRPRVYSAFRRASSRRGITIQDSECQRLRSCLPAGRIWPRGLESEEWRSPWSKEYGFVSESFIARPAPRRDFRVKYVDYVTHFSYRARLRAGRLIRV